MALGRPISKGVYEQHITRQTIWFAGKAVSASGIARAIGGEQSQVSRTFSGSKRGGALGLNGLRKMAAVLGMTLDEFLLELDKHQEELAKKGGRVVDGHYTRLAQEAGEDIKTIREGGIPKPRISDIIPAIKD